MAALTCQTQDGKTIVSGKTYTLTLAKGSKLVRSDATNDDYSERVIKGTVRAFETEARYDVVTGEQTQAPETRWEILTDDPQYPAIGFLPENALTHTGK